MVDWYQQGLRPLLFYGVRADPEWLHRQTLIALRNVATADLIPGEIQSRAYHALRTWLGDRYQYANPRLQQSLWQIDFPNPLGLAAGFDKDGLAAPAWSLLGFGYAELGTVTYHAQPGNPRPRLFRLPKDQAAINRMGFNNQGAAQLAERLRFYQQHRAAVIPLGINLGKSKVTPLDQAVEDYLGSFRLLKQLGDYFVVNVSSPNTPGLRSLQAAENLSPILAALQAENSDRKPLLVKIAPDLDWDSVEVVLALAQTHQLGGIIATNTTIQRQGLKTDRILQTGNRATEEPGGLSGAPLRHRATAVVRFLATKSEGSMPIIGVGGIFSAQDAWEKISAGASLLQVYTGWIYQGPGMSTQVLKGLVRQLDHHRLDNIGDAVGQNLPYISE